MSFIPVICLTSPPRVVPRSFTSVGAYPLLYLTESDSVLCADCAAQGDGDDPTATCGVNWEDPHLTCDECSERIESAYADDEDPS